MAKKEVLKSFTPTEVCKIINENLLDKPNKKVVFNTVVKNVDVMALAKNLIKFSNLDLDSYQELTDLLNEKIELKKDDEIVKLENELKQIQGKLNSLKS